MKRFPQLTLPVLTNSGSAARCSQANTRETSAGWEGKIALCRKPATWGEGRLVYENQLQRVCMTMKVLKQESSGWWGQSLC